MGGACTVGNHWAHGLTSVRVLKRVLGDESLGVPELESIPTTADPGNQQLLPHAGMEWMLPEVYGDEPIGTVVHLADGSVILEHVEEGRAGGQQHYRGVRVTQARTISKRANVQSPCLLQKTMIVGS